MKCFQRCCCLLFALVLSFGVFSINANAQEVEVPKTWVNHSVTIYDMNNTQLKWLSLNFTGYNNSQESLQKADIFTMEKKTSYRFETCYEFGTNELPLISKGGNTVVTMFEGYYGVGFKNTNTSEFVYLRGVSNLRALVTYSDNTTQYYDDVTYTLEDSKITVKFEFEPQKDVKKIKFIVNQVASTGSYPALITIYLGEMHGIDKGYKLSANQASAEQGLLSGILGWVQNIFNNVKDGFESVKNGFVNIGNWIKELPSKIWEFISDGLKSLFIPSEDFIVSYKEDIDELLSNKLGAVYQVVNITLESWNRITVSDEQNTINLPKTTINLPENNKFSFGGYDVKIVPDGFNVLSEAIKIIGGICVTILFVNGLCRRYDEVMGVEQ